MIYQISFAFGGLCKNRNAQAALLSLVAAAVRELPQGAHPPVAGKAQVLGYAPFVSRNN